MKAVFDIGGTTTRIAAYDNESLPLKPVVFKTPKKFDEATRKLVGEIKTIISGGFLTAVAGGLAGVISVGGKIERSVNLPNYENRNLLNILKKEFNCDVYLENDCTMIGLGEIEKLRLDNTRVVAYVTISTGVGAKRFVEGKPSESYLNFEPGKQVLLVENKKNKTWEELVSGSAIFKNTGKIPSTIKDRKFWDLEESLVAMGLYNLILHWRPDLVVIGGGVVINAQLSISGIEKHLKKINTIYPSLPKIIKAKLGDFGGLYGARSYLEKIKKNA